MFNCVTFFSYYMHMYILCDTLFAVLLTSLDARKPVCKIFDQVILIPACSATETI